MDKNVTYKINVVVNGKQVIHETTVNAEGLGKNYAMDWSAAGEIQDKIQMTAKNGVTSFEQLAAALPRVTGNAATLGVSIDELMAAFATLTGVSGNTAEVSTQLAAIFTALVKPSSEATEMAKQMGIEFDAMAIKAAGGYGSLAEVNANIAQFQAVSAVGNFC
ncbi:MAG: phage tail tape measure protein [Bacteroidaceae bacterium]|nr:phage tail tape measure protein [Bacteroidaceae bacterium]